MNPQMASSSSLLISQNTLYPPICWRYDVDTHICCNRFLYSLAVCQASIETTKPFRSKISFFFCFGERFWPSFVSFCSSCWKTLWLFQRLMCERVIDFYLIYNINLPSFSSFWNQWCAKWNQSFLHWMSKHWFSLLFFDRIRMWMNTCFARAGHFST